MPQDITFLTKTTNRFKEFNNNNIENSLANIKLYDNNLNYFKDLILYYSKEMYSNPFIKELIEFKSGMKISNKSLNFINSLISHNDIGSILKSNTNKDILLIYIRGFIKSYDELLDAQYLYNNSIKFKDIPDSTIMYIIRSFFSTVEQSILRGNSFRLNRVEATIKIVNKVRKKSKYGNKILRKTEDWGKSMKFLKEQAKTLDFETYTLYDTGKINKREFIKRLSPYLYSPTNKNGLKWIFYCDKDSDHWLILSHKYSTIPNIRFYSIIPKNDIATAEQSQIKFTNNCKSVDDIIDTRLLGLRDKIRALERFDLDYCLKTFKSY
jgi:UDP-N-acetylglucosamine transferase subunit ALG13